MNLTDLRPLMARRRDGALSFDRFRTDPTVAALRWPDDVLEQFLFDHGDNTAFINDYNPIDLHAITWQLEIIPAAHFTGMPTGASDEGCIESYAKNPVHWVTVRPPQVARCWEEMHGSALGSADLQSARPGPGQIHHGAQAQRRCLPGSPVPG
ncbi:hypothetical protein ACFYT5_38760 [Streptomyces anulatus]|uniref:hypothetical protein n=1 Tax=Streptomyces anulatus TaxID=1892 RepID=UPI00367733B7